MRRPVYAGKCFVELSPTGNQFVVGIRPNAFVLAEKAGAGAVADFAPGLDGVAPKATVARIEAGGGGKVELTEAEVVVSGGR